MPRCFYLHLTLEHLKRLPVVVVCRGQLDVSQGLRTVQRRSLVISLRRGAAFRQHPSLGVGTPRGKQRHGWGRHDARTQALPVPAVTVIRIGGPPFLRGPRSLPPGAIDRYASRIRPTTESRDRTVAHGLRRQTECLRHVNAWLPARPTTNRASEKGLVGRGPRRRRDASSVRCLCSVRTSDAWCGGSKAIGWLAKAAALIQRRSTHRPVRAAGYDRYGCFVIANHRRQHRPAW